MTEAHSTEAAELHKQLLLATQKQIDVWVEQYEGKMPEKVFIAVISACNNMLTETANRFREASSTTYDLVVGWSEGKRLPDSEMRHLFMVRLSSIILTQIKEHEDYIVRQSKKT